jgi:hypothetical protein
MKYLLVDRYMIEARIYPAIATLPPFILLNYFYLQLYLSDFINTTLTLAIGGISVSIVFVFLLMEVNRLLSKMVLERRYFKNELTMPTTDFLLFKDGTYSEDYKNKIRNKISAEFGAKLPSKREENTEELSARQKITEAVSFVRTKMKSGRLLLQHNIHYGMARNLIGGAYIALLVSALDFIIFMLVSPNQIAAVISLILICLYGSIIAFRKYILTAHAKYYARVLFQEYLAS